MEVPDIILSSTSMVSSSTPSYMSVISTSVVKLLSAPITVVASSEFVFWHLDHLNGWCSGVLFNLL